MQQSQLELIVFFFQAFLTCTTLWVRSAKCRHLSPESRQCFIHGEVIGFHVVPRSTRASRWSSPVLQKGSC